MGIEPIADIVIHLVILHAHAEGAETVHAEEVVMNVAALDVAIDIDQGVEVTQRSIVIGLSGDDFPDHSVGLRVVRS